MTTQGRCKMIVEYSLPIKLILHLPCSIQTHVIYFIYWQLIEKHEFISFIGSWLVNLAGCILLYGLLKFQVGFVAKLFHDLLPSVLNFTASEILTLHVSYTLSCILKCANEFKTISNWLTLLLRCIRNFWTRQAHSRDIYTCNKYLY